MSARCIWLTRNELSLPDTELAQLVDERFTDAPADATEAVARQLYAALQARYPNAQIIDPEGSMNACRETARAVLAALRAPE